MNDNKSWGYFVIAAALLMLMFVGGLVGFILGQRYERGRAVEAGVGHYVTDPKAGQTIDFVYGAEK